MAALSRARIQETSLNCLNKHHDRCEGWHGPWDYTANHPKCRCVCACHGAYVPFEPSRDRSGEKARGT